MRKQLFADLGAEIRQTRQKRGMTQPELARRVGRDPARISEFERDLLNQRLGKDRLTLLAEICDALNLVPILVPKAKISSVKEILSQSRVRYEGPVGSAFDDVFVDLGKSDE